MLDHADFTDYFDDDANAYNIERFGADTGLDAPGYSNDEHAAYCKAAIRFMHEHNTGHGHDSAAIAERWLVRITKPAALCCGLIGTLAPLMVLS